MNNFVSMHRSHLIVSFPGYSMHKKEHCRIDFVTMFTILPNREMIPEHTFYWLFRLFYICGRIHVVKCIHIAIFEVISLTLRISIKPRVNRDRTYA